MNFIVNLLILLPSHIASHFVWAGPLIMRLVVGYVFMLSGWGKLNNLPQITQNFAEWGILFPKIMTPFVSGGFAVWHDRAVFHFLTKQADRDRYVARARAAVRPGGYIIVASFAPEGPERCSGLDVVRYSPETMQAQFGADFHLLDSRREEHHTPSGATQAFVYCLCRVDGS